MGKSQKKRAVRRHNPVRVPDSHLPGGLEAAAATSSRKDAVLPIIQKLEGPEAPDRAWACSAVSNLIQNDPSTRRLLQGKNIVGTLINRLSDNVEEVVMEATGALRNLCIDGGYGLCAEMYNKNILTHLKTFIPKISNTLQQLLTSPKSAPENAVDLVFGFAENVITILWCLSETSNKALNAINQMALVPFLMAFLENREKLAPKTVTAAAQCLYVLTDDNVPVIEDVRSNSSYTSCLLRIAVPTDIAVSQKGKEAVDDRVSSLQILSAGILRNISPIPLPSAVSMVDIDRSVVLPLLVPVITSISLSQVSESVTDLLAKEDEPTVDKLSLKHAPRHDHKTPTERELERIEENLRNIELALEILTAVCATLPDPEPDIQDGDDMDEKDDEDADVEDVGMDVDEAVPVNGAPKLAESPAPSLLPKILEPVLSLVHPTPLSFPLIDSSPSPHPPTTSALSAIHIRALECLNNIFLSLAVSPNPEITADLESGKRVWDALWAALNNVGVEGGRGQEQRKDMWDTAVGVLWGVANIWKGGIAPHTDQVQILTQLCNAASDESVKVKCIGTLECLAQHPESIEANKIISSYLLSCLPAPSTPSSQSTEPMLQAASALIDIYSDENMPYDVNFRQDNYLEILASSVAGVKKAVKSIDIRKEGGKDLRRRGQEILGNLVAFVAYRRNLKL